MYIEQYELDPQIKHI